jgi:hypothetical protein
MLFLRLLKRHDMEFFVGVSVQLIDFLTSKLHGVSCQFYASLALILRKERQMSTRSNPDALEKETSLLPRGIE